MLLLVGHLPQDAALGASVRGGSEFRAWTPDMYLLAGVVNLLNAANRQRAGKRSSSPLVKPPTVKQQPRVMTVAEIARRQQAATHN